MSEQELENTVTVLPPNATSSPLCGICIEPFNKLRPATTCPYCQHTACSKCCRTYLLSQSTPKCMKCLCEWTRGFIRQSFPAVFLKELKMKRIQLKQEQETFMLPLAQKIIDHKKRTTELLKHAQHIQGKLERLYEQVRLLKIEKTRACRNVYAHANGLLNKTVSYVRPCPENGCRGFLSQQWKCGLCEKWTCSQCHEVKQEGIDHVCKEENIQSAKLIGMDSKPCPKCHAFIFKIDGCNQLWCVNCHTAFDWRTGVIVEDTRNFHNPHYFDWLRSQNQERPADNCPDNCPQEINSVFLIRFYQDIQMLRASDESLFQRMNVFIHEKCRKLMEIRVDILPKYQTHLEKENEELRIQYLNQMIDKDKFHAMISRRFTFQETKRENGQILAMFVTSMTDIVIRFKQALRESLEKYAAPKMRTRRQSNNPVITVTAEESSKINEKVIQPYFTEMQNLCEYTNLHFTEITESFGLKRMCHIIPDTFEFVLFTAQNQKAAIDSGVAAVVVADAVVAAAVVVADAVVADAVVADAVVADAVVADAVVAAENTSINSTLT